MHKIGLVSVVFWVVAAVLNSHGNTASETTVWN